MIIHVECREETISISLSSVATLARVRDYIMEFCGDLATVDVDLWDADGIVFSWRFLGIKENNNFDDMLNRIAEWLYSRGVE